MAVLMVVEGALCCMNQLMPKRKVPGAFTSGIDNNFFTSDTPISTTSIISPSSFKPPPVKVMIISDR